MHSSQPLNGDAGDRSKRRQQDLWQLQIAPATLGKPGSPLKTLVEAWQPASLPLEDSSVCSKTGSGRGVAAPAPALADRWLGRRVA